MEENTLTDEQIQEWGDEYASELCERDENPLSNFCKISEAFINGARAVIDYFDKKKVHL